VPNCSQNWVHTEVQGRKHLNTLGNNLGVGTNDGGESTPYGIYKKRDKIRPIRSEDLLENGGVNKPLCNM